MGEDNYWDLPPPPGKTRPARPDATEADSAWDAPGSAATGPRHRRPLPWRYTTHVLAGLGVFAALGLAALTLIGSPTETLDLSSGAGLRPVVAAVSLGGGRTSDQVCRDYDIPVRLCDLSRDCRADLRAMPGSDTSATARSEQLILRSTEDSCGKTVAQLRRRSNRP